MGDVRQNSSVYRARMIDLAVPVLGYSPEAYIGLLLARA